MHLDNELLKAIEQLLEQKLEQKLEPIKKSVAELQESVQVTKAAVIRMEQVALPKIMAALDIGAANEEAIHNHENRIVSLEDMTERNTIEITVLKTAK